MSACDKLLFGTAGCPQSASKRTSISGIARLGELGLDAMELEYVRGSFPKEASAGNIADAACSAGIRLTAHGPYYINLNAVEPEKLEASRERVLKTARIGSLSGAESVTFHAGFYLGLDGDVVFKTIAEELAALAKILRDEGTVVDLRPELTGKASQFGSLDELLELAAGIESVEPCIDWSHLHARTGANNTAREFEAVLDEIRRCLGDHALKHCHMHVSGIEYTDKGERKHCLLEDSDMNYRDLLRVLTDNGAAGFLICESPVQEDDARRMKDFYLAL